MPMMLIELVLDGLHDILVDILVCNLVNDYIFGNLDLIVKVTILKNSF